MAMYVAEEHRLPADPPSFAKVSYDLGIIGQVMGHLRRNDTVKAIIGKRQRQCRSDHTTITIANAQSMLIDVKRSHAPRPASPRRPGGQFPAKFTRAGTYVQHLKAPALLSPDQRGKKELKWTRETKESVEPPQLPVQRSHLHMRVGRIIEVFGFRAAAGKR